jgi:hypothetical protein
VIRRLDVILSVLIPACFHARPILSVRHAWQLNSATRFSEPTTVNSSVMRLFCLHWTYSLNKALSSMEWKIHHISGSWGGSYN